MRLTKVEYLLDGPNAGINITFTQGGVKGVHWLPIPEGWAEMTRAEKKAHVVAEVESYLSNRVLIDPAQIVLPDTVGAETAKDEFEGMPGWADWNAAQAEAWIDANVTDLASAKNVLSKMARAVIYLRDIVIER